LRAHVPRRADRKARPGQVRAARRTDCLRDAEVRLDRVPLREQDVLWLDVPVQDAHAVRVGECIGHGRRDRQRLVRARRTPARKLLAQRAAVDVRHDIIEEPARFARVVQGEDVWVGEAGGDLDLLQKPLDAEKGGEAGQENFERDAAPMLAVVREVHGSHAAAAEHLTEFVALGERRREVGGDIRWHGVRIEGRAGDVTAQAMATPGTEAGQYVASLTLPRASAWTITIYSGFGNSRVTLPPLLAIAPGAQPPLTPPESERGRRLFVAKGCVTCHVHGDIEGSGTVAVGPELTGRRWPAEYLKLFLANPAIAPRSGTFRMPDLGLKPQEIAALAAFLNAEHQALQ